MCGLWRTLDEIASGMRMSKVKRLCARFVAGSKRGQARCVVDGTEA